MSLSSTLLLVVIASIPIQLGKFIFLDHSYVLGIPIDYRALSIYFSDLTVISYILISFAEKYREIPNIYKKNKAYIITIFIFNLFLLSNILFSTSKLASLLFTIKINIFSILSIFAIHTFSMKPFQVKAKIVLKIAIFFESLIIISQFLFQKSLGLWILGERNFDSTTVSIAHVQILGAQLLRAYGTFPHPNVAASFLLFSTIIVSNPKFKKIHPIPLLFFTAIAMIFTFSKSALIVVLSSLLIFSDKAKRLLLLIIASIFLIAFFKAAYFSTQIATIAERVLLAQVALDISSKNLFFGVGSNNFILKLSSFNLTSLSQTRLLQPVHNVFLLILAENGLFGLLLFSLLLFVVSKNIKSKKSAAIFIGMLVYASIDHFFWTLQQGQIIFFLLFSYILGFKNKA